MRATLNYRAFTIYSKLMEDNPSQCRVFLGRKERGLIIGTAISFFPLGSEPWKLPWQ
jgi:hypothetical protein